MEAAIRLLVYEKNPLYREGLRLLLQNEKDFEVVLDTSDAAHALAYVLQDHIDLSVVSLDFSQSDLDSYGSFVWELGLKTKVLILSNLFREEVMLGAACAGVKGYLCGNISAHDVVRAIREISDGGMCFQALNTNDRSENGPASTWLTHPPGELTPQEFRVFELIRQRLRNKEIAARLNISEKTVKCHVNRIFKKLKITKRIQAMDYPGSLMPS
jgi:DNA-binding NarL/FixJ family response regulator